MLAYRFSTVPTVRSSLLKLTSSIIVSATNNKIICDIGVAVNLMCAQVFGVGAHETIKLTEKIVDCKIGSSREAYHQLCR